MHHGSLLLVLVLMFLAVTLRVRSQAVHASAQIQNKYQETMKPRRVVSDLHFNASTCNQRTILDRVPIRKLPRFSQLFEDPLQALGVCSDAFCELALAGDSGDFGAISLSVTAGPVYWAQTLYEDTTSDNLPSLVPYAYGMRFTKRADDASAITARLTAAERNAFTNTSLLSNCTGQAVYWKSDSAGCRARTKMDDTTTTQMPTQLAEAVYGQLPDRDTTALEVSRGTFSAGPAQCVAALCHTCDSSLPSNVTLDLGFEDSTLVTPITIGPQCMIHTIDNSAPQAWVDINVTVHFGALQETMRLSGPVGTLVTSSTISAAIRSIDNSALGETTSERRVSPGAIVACPLETTTTRHVSMGYSNPWRTMNARLPIPTNQVMDLSDVPNQSASHPWFYLSKSNATRWLGSNCSLCQVGSPAHSECMFGNSSTIAQMCSDDTLQEYYRNGGTLPGIGSCNATMTPAQILSHMNVQHNAAQATFSSLGLEPSPGNPSVDFLPGDWFWTRRDKMYWPFFSESTREHPHALLYEADNACNESSEIEVPIELSFDISPVIVQFSEARRNIQLETTNFKAASRTTVNQEDDGDGTTSAPSQSATPTILTSTTRCSTSTTGKQEEGSSALVVFTLRMCNFNTIDEVYNLGVYCYNLQMQNETTLVSNITTVGLSSRAGSALPQCTTLTFGPKEITYTGASLEMALEQASALYNASSCFLQVEDADTGTIFAVSATEKDARDVTISDLYHSNRTAANQTFAAFPLECRSHFTRSANFDLEPTNIVEESDSEMRDIMWITLAVASVVVTVLIVLIVLLLVISLFDKSEKDITAKYDKQDPYLFSSVAPR